MKLKMEDTNIINIKNDKNIVIERYSVVLLLLYLYYYLFLYIYIDLPKKNESRDK